eukprot:g18241.t1
MRSSIAALFSAAATTFFLNTSNTALVSACSLDTYIYAQYNGVWKQALVKRITNDGLFALQWVHDGNICADTSTGVNVDNAYCTACAANCYVHPTQALEYRQPAVYTAFCSANAGAASSGGGEDEGLGGGALAGIIIGGVVLLACFAYGCYNFVRENRAEAAAGDLSERRTMKKGMSFAWGRGMTMELGKKVGNPLGGRKKTAPEATAVNRRIAAARGLAPRRHATSLAPRQPRAFVARPLADFAKGGIAARPPTNGQSKRRTSAGSARWRPSVRKLARWAEMNMN